MHIKINSVAFKIALAWTAISSEYPLEVFDNQSNSLGERKIKFLSENHCEIDGKDFLIYPQEDKEKSDHIVVFLVATISMRPSYIWSQ